MARGAAALSLLYGLMVMVVPGVEAAPHLRLVWMLPGSPVSWGLAIMGIGAVAMAGVIARRPRLSWVGLNAGAAWMTMVGVAGVVRAGTGDAGALPAACMYWGSAALIVLVAWAVKRTGCGR